MRIIQLEDRDRRALDLVRKDIRDWCRQHQLEFAVLEMTVGAGALALGVHSGAIRIGTDLVGSVMSGSNLESGVGGVLGGSIGAVASTMLGSIGVAAGGTGIAVPAGVLTGGGALLLGALGYTAGDILHHYLNPPVKLSNLLANASLFTVGLALLIDGARRAAKDPRVRAAASSVRSGVIYLCEVVVDVVVRDIAELQAWARQHAAEFVAKSGPFGGLGVVGLATAGGVAVGSSVAASTVTVLGSHTFGAAALSFGLVSAPLWPVIAGGAVGLGLSYVAWTALRHNAGTTRS